MRARRRRRSQAGFTLIELMISLVMFSIAIAGVLSVAVSMVNGFREQRLAMNAETSARAGMEYIADAIRGASPGVPTGNVQHVASFCTAPVANAAFLPTYNSAAPDELTVAFAYGSVVTSSRSVYGNGTTSLDVGDASELAINDTILISNTAQGHLVKITGKAGNTLSLESQGCGSLPAVVTTTGYGVGSLIVRAAQVRFYIDLIDNVPTLMMEPEADRTGVQAEPLAEGVEDFQVAVAYDVNGDGQIDELTPSAAADEWFGNSSSDGAPSGAIRAIRISVVARSTGRLTGTATQYRPAVEDHAVATSPDNYRRRVLSSIVEIRNLDGSP